MLLHRGGWEKNMDEHTDKPLSWLRRLPPWRIHTHSNTCLVKRKERERNSDVILINSQHTHLEADRVQCLLCCNADHTEKCTTAAAGKQTSLHDFTLTNRNVHFFMINFPIKTFWTAARARADWIIRRLLWRGNTDSLPWQLVNELICT